MSDVCVHVYVIRQPFRLPSGCMRVAKGTYLRLFKVKNFLKFQVYSIIIAQLDTVTTNSGLRVTVLPGAR